MKANHARSRIGWISLALLSSALTAQAFYNPQTGRWLNRDPMHEFSFRMGSTHPLRGSSRHSTAENTYDVLHQDPLNKVDLLGLCICKGVLYNPFTACCCKGEVLKRKRVKTGIKFCHTPIQGYPYMTHTFLEVDGDFSAGFYPVGSPFGGRGVVDHPDEASDRENKSCWDYELSPCHHDIKAIKECIQTAVQKDEANPPHYVLGAFDCATWAHGIVEGCRNSNARCAPYP